MSDAKPMLFGLDELGARRELPARVLCGDMRKVLAAMPPESVHAVVTDPPYGLEFMGKQWDQSVPGPEHWSACLRVAKPGAYLLAFGGTRTAHRLACAIEDAGWEIRDCVMWLYGSGFPKSHDVSKAIDKEAGVVREVVGEGPNASRRPNGACRVAYQGACGGDPVTAPATDAAHAWDGWGTALKPAWEPVYLCRKPMKGSVAGNVLEHGCGGLNIDATRIASEKATGWGGGAAGGNTWNDSNSNCGLAKDGAARPVSGRWPANLVLDEAAAALLDAQTGDVGAHGRVAKDYPDAQQVAYRLPCTGLAVPRDSYGGASRFFYTAKASRSEREAGLDRFEPSIVNDGRDTPIDNPYQRGDTLRKCTHPTVKPIALMRWLVRLVTPPGGTVLDPFTGSGSTGVAAVLEGARFIGCELSAEYAQLATARIAHAADEDDGPQLTLFERQELKPVAKVHPTQASFGWLDEEEPAL